MKEEEEGRRWGPRRTSGAWCLHQTGGGGREGGRPVSQPGVLDCLSGGEGGEAARLVMTGGAGRRAATQHSSSSSREGGGSMWRLAGCEAGGVLYTHTRYTTHTSEHRPYREQTRATHLYTHKTRSARLESGDYGPTPWGPIMGRREREAAPGEGGSERGWEGGAFARTARHHPAICVVAG